MQLLKTHREKSKISLNFRVRGLTYITVCCSFLNSTDSAECWKISREICCSSLTKFQYCILRTSLIFLGSLPREFRHSLHLQIWNTKDPRLNDFVVQKKKKKKRTHLITKPNSKVSAHVSNSLKQLMELVESFISPSVPDAVSISAQ